MHDYTKVFWHFFDYKAPSWYAGLTQRYVFTLLSAKFYDDYFAKMLGFEWISVISTAFGEFSCLCLHITQRTVWKGFSTLNDKNFKLFAISF